MKQLESLKKFELSNEQLTNINGGLGGPAPSKVLSSMSTAAGTYVVHETNTLSYSADTDWGDGHITYYNCNAI